MATQVTSSTAAQAVAVTPKLTSLKIPRSCKGYPFDKKTSTGKAVMMSLWSYYRPDEQGA